MSRYSSDSETSVSSRKKKNKSSRRSSSRSPSPKHRCKKKQKKYKSSGRSHSKERRGRGSSSERGRKHYNSISPVGRHRHRSRSWSSSSRNREKKRRSSRSSSRSRRRSNDRRRRRRSTSRRSSRSLSSSSGSYKKSKKSSRTQSQSKSPIRQKKFEYDADDLLMRLNKAAIEAMAANKKLTDPINTLEMQVKREELINQIKSDGFTSQSFISGQSQSKNEEAPLVVDLTSDTSNPPPPLPAESLQESKEPLATLLHPNFLLENQEDKLNRWIKKLFILRQRAMNEDYIIM